MTNSTEILATLKSSPIQEIIQRYAIGTLATVEKTLETSHGLEVSRILFEIRKNIILLVEQMSLDALPIRTLDAISKELLNVIHLCVEAKVASEASKHSIKTLLN